MFQKVSYFVNCTVPEDQGVYPPWTWRSVLIPITQAATTLLSSLLQPGLPCKLIITHYSFRLLGQHVLTLRDQTPVHPFSHPPFRQIYTAYLHNTAKCWMGADLTPDLQTSTKRSPSHRSSKAIFSSTVHFTCKSLIMALILACF